VSAITNSKNSLAYVLEEIYPKVAYVLEEILLILAYVLENLSCFFVFGSVGSVVNKKYRCVTWDTPIFSTITWVL
jgi:hypothetical protein